jgi:hypothetical protein
MSVSGHEKINLSWRSRLFIRIHHLAVASLIAWIALLFIAGEFL